MKNSTKIAIISSSSATVSGLGINYLKYKKINHRLHIAIGGALTSAVVTSFYNYKRFKNGEVDEKKAIKNSIEGAAIGTISSILTIAAADILIKK